MTRNSSPPADMLRELMNDNKAVAKAMREAHEVGDKHEDVATASLLENFIDDSRKAHLVPVRGEPGRRCHRALIRAGINHWLSWRRGLLPSLTGADPARARRPRAQLCPDVTIESRRLQCEAVLL